MYALPFFKNAAEIYNIVIHFFRNHILDQICTTILDGENVDLSKMHLVFGLETDGSATEMRRAYKIKPEHLNCKVCKGSHQKKTGKKVHNSCELSPKMENPPPPPISQQF